MRKRTWLMVAGAVVAATPLAGLVGSPATASSHREAPLISQDPQADNTDLYAFRDTDDPSKLNIIANYIGMEDPNGGPNFVRFSDDVLYSVHVDNNGDVVDDVTYNVRFRTTIVNPNTFLYNTGQVTSPTDPDLTYRQTYTVQKVTAAGSTILASDVVVPPVNVGVRSNPQASYESSTAQPTITALAGGGKVFAGSREDPFFVDLGSIFDLGALRPIQNNHLIPLPSTNGVDALGGKNVHTIALQVPITSVTAGGVTPVVVDNKSSVVGIYASSSRQRVRVLSPAGAAPRNAGKWVQVSRLGIPLVNEVLIPIAKKDQWNSVDPKDDGANGFFTNILDPEFTKLLPVLYPGVFSNNNIPQGGAANRPDLVALVTGQLAGLSSPNQLPAADLLRVNLASPAGAAFPNGRRLADDVVDIEIQVLAGFYTDPDQDGFINNLNGSGSSGIPYSALKDGVNATDGTLLSVFPYVGTPFNGFTQRSCNNPSISCPAP